MFLLFICCSLTKHQDWSYLQNENNVMLDSPLKL